MNGQRLLLDQMLDTDVASTLLAAGYDVVRVAELGMARSDDDSILARAIALERVQVTLDEHFGDWAVLPLRNHTGVIRVRADPATTESILAVLMPFLRQFKDASFKNTLVIVSKSRARWIKTGEL
jgi:predicted nuclease of predicted toxin-antitoxin system